MAARILSTIVFWLLMAVLIPGAVVVVVCAYLPFVVLKAAWLAVTGRLHEAVGDGVPDEGDMARPHIG